MLPHCLKHVRVCDRFKQQTLDIIEAYAVVNTVKDALSVDRNNDSEIIFQESSKMAHKADLDCLQMPKSCGRQTQRNNVLAHNTEQYFARATFNLL